MRLDLINDICELRVIGSGAERSTSPNKGAVWKRVWVSVSLVFNYFLQKVGKIDQFGRMLPDSFPVFNIELDCDFESSDNVYPSYGAMKMLSKGKGDNGTTFLQEQNLTSFSTIGRRNDNLDRTYWLQRPKMLLVALLDGHCDPQPTDYIHLHLLPKLANHPDILTKPESALLEVFEEMERQVIKRFEKGSTAIVLLAIQETLIVANLGDSKLFGIDEQKMVHTLTEPHNLGNQQQLMEVINRGGIVLKKGSQYRINGELNLSRSFGDRHLKHCMSSTPDLYRFDRRQYKRWVLASDGFYNAKNAEKRLTLSQLSELKEDGTIYLDNASAIFLDF